MIQHRATAVELQEFTSRDCTIGGDECFLIFPNHIGAKWTKNNEIYRSSIWRKSDNAPVSLGFPKFYNWNEHPELCPDPTTLHGATAVEKIDGSCLIVSKYKGQIIIRTRGTVDAFLQDTGPEIRELTKRYPLAFAMDTVGDTAPYSLLFEYTSPNMRIVLDYGDVPDIRLIGKVYHEDYRLETQKQLDIAAQVLGVKRPRTFTFESIEQMIKSVQAFKGQEGVVVYFDHDQKMKKLKGLEYLAMHSFKSDCTLPKMVDLFIALGYPSYNKFVEEVQKMAVPAAKPAFADLAKEELLSAAQGGRADFEVLSMARRYISQITDAWKEVEQIIAHMQLFIAGLGKPAHEAFIRVWRKEAAQSIKAAYGKTNRASFCFKMLDGQPLSDDEKKKLLFQMLVK